MSRRYWSSEPSSNDDFLLRLVTAIRMAAPESGERPDHAGPTRGQVAPRGGARCVTATAKLQGTTRRRAELRSVFRPHAPATASWHIPAVGTPSTMLPNSISQPPPPDIRHPRQ